MPGWRDFLDRFRPAGAPGAASPGGIPVDRAAAASAELMPLLERLDGAQDEADRLRVAARNEAARVSLTGKRTAADLVQQARDNVETIAAQAVSAAMKTAAHNVPGDDSEAAAAVVRRAAQRQSAAVELVVAAARDLIAGLRGPENVPVPR